MHVNFILVCLSLICVVFKNSNGKGKFQLDIYVNDKLMIMLFLFAAHFVSLDLVVCWTYRSCLLSSHSHTPSSSEAGDSGKCKLITFLSLAQGTEGEERSVKGGGG